MIRYKRYKNGFVAPVGMQKTIEWDEVKKMIVRVSREKEVVVENVISALSDVLSAHIVQNRKVEVRHLGFFTTALREVNGKVEATTEMTFCSRLRRMEVETEEIKEVNSR